MVEGISEEKGGAHMKRKSRPLLHITAFVCIITLLLMTACGAGKTGSGTGVDINSHTETANGTVGQADLIMVCAHMGMYAEFDEEG